MNVDRRDALIELDAAEVSAFRGQTKATPKMLADKQHPAGAYSSFRDKVEHIASEIHHDTDRTVLICDVDTCDTLARYNERGLIDD